MKLSYLLYRKLQDFLKHHYRKEDITLQLCNFIALEVSYKDWETSYKNDVTIGTKKGVFDYLYVEIPKEISDKKSGFYDSILDQLTDAQKKEIATKNRSNTSHEAGRYILIDLPEEGLKLEFVNNEKKDLRSIIITSKIKK